MAHSDDAERQIIGASLVGGRSVVDDIHDADLRAADFSTPQRQAIWSAVLALSDKGAEISALSVADFLESSKNLDAVGGAGELGKFQSAGIVVGVREAASIVVEHAALRRIAEASTLIARSAIERDADAASLLQRAQEIFFRLARRTARQTYADRAAVARRLVEAAAAGEPARGLPTGWRSLDGLLTRGLLPGQLVVVAARPAMGKSAFSQQLAAFSADHHASAALFSLEMSDEELVARELVQATRVQQTRWRQNLTKVTNASARISERPLYLYDCPGATLSFIASSLRRVTQQVGVGLAVVDYLQLMRSESTKRDQNKADAIGEITGGLKNLARELKIPIILLSQLNRSVESRPDKHPMMSDLRDSGTIEQDADIVLFLYRPEYYLREKTPPKDVGMAEVIVAKNRGGPTGVAMLRWDGEAMKFSDEGA